MRTIAGIGLSIILLTAGQSAAAFQTSRIDQDRIIRPRAVEGAGIYFNSLGLILDGVFTEEGAARDGRDCLFWEDEETSFTLDLGGRFVLTGLRIQADGNDDYLVEYSLEGEEYQTLAVFLEEFRGGEPGMFTMSNVPNDEYRVGLPESEPVPAGYVRISASRGDGRFSLSELQLLGYPDEEEPDTEREGDPIRIASVAGSGSFMHSVDLLIDGAIPPEGEGPRSHSCVYWEELDSAFVFDLGKSLELTGLVIQVDGDDGYVIEYSMDGLNYIHLLEIRPEHGEVLEGMDTLGALPGHRESLEDLEFWPIQARFLRLAAVGGEGVFSASELQVYIKR